MNRLDKLSYNVYRCRHIALNGDGYTHKRYIMKLINQLEHRTGNRGSHRITITDPILKDFFANCSKYSKLKRTNKSKNFEFVVPFCKGAKYVKATYVQVLCDICDLLIEREMRQ